MILSNKLGITNQIELAKTEEKISKQKAKQLFDSGDINKVDAGQFTGLTFIHAYLFGDIYEFAGQVRDVNISKGNFRFAPVMYLETSLKHIDAMQRSPVKDLEIKTLLKAALTDQIHDRTLYMKGIDVSYYYEGYSEFKTEEL